MLFAGWVLAPFIGLAVADRVSTRWSALTRTTLYGVMLVVTLASVAIYGAVVWRPAGTPAFTFLVVPLASWLFMTIVVSTAALISHADVDTDDFRL